MNLTMTKQKELKAIFLQNPGPEDSRRIRHIRWSLGIAALVVWSLALCAISLYFARPGYGRELFFSYFTSPLLFILNLLPVLFVVALVFFISNRIWISVLSSGILIMIPTLINYYKLLSRNDPLLASDIRLLSEAANISTGYTFSVGPALIVTLIGIVLSVVGSAFLLRARIARKRNRILGIVLVLAVGAGLFATVYRDGDLYTATSNVDVYMSNGKTMSPWSDTDQYVSRGFLYPLLYSFKTSGNETPEGYSEETAQEILSAYPSADIPDDQKVSVISVMLEAYNDLTTLGLETESADPYAFLHELQQESVSGQLVTNIFAGGTIDTERQYITGNSTAFEYRSAAGSYARYFEDQGYFTEFCHPCYDWFYNRRNVAEYFGFSSSYFFEDRYTMPDGWGIMHDEEFFPDLITLYEEATEDGTPYFNFSVTYQGHGPYPEDYLERGIEYVPQGDLSDSAYYIINNYLGSIAETDTVLRDFVDYFRDLDEPIILVFFGDHNPWLGSGAYVYDELGIDINLDSEQGFYNYYSTPYVIWANDAAKDALDADFVGDGGTFSPCFLMTRLFDLCGWEGDSFMQLNRELFASVDIISTTGRYRENGLLTDQLSPETQDLLSDYQIASFYRMQDAY
jgi:phosphoglycerol transferase MdoB-like AlkP superfamily enzyme